MHLNRIHKSGFSSKILYCFRGPLCKVSEVKKKRFCKKEKGKKGKPLDTAALFLLLLCEVMLIYEAAGRSMQRVEKSKGAHDRAERTLLARQQLQRQR